MLVNVKYTGKRIPITLTMPWLDQPVTFVNDRMAQMIEKDAIRLCAEAPRDFRIIEPVVQEDLGAPMVEPPRQFLSITAVPDVTPAPKARAKRRRHKDKE